MAIKETRRTRPQPISSTFEDKTTATLEAQDRLLERLEQKLEAPVLNGGFEELTKKVDKIETVQQLMRDTIAESSKKIEDIHTVIYDPEKGIYVTIKSHSRWIEQANATGKWIGALAITGLLTGVGKLLYEFVTGHLHFTR